MLVRSFVIAQELVNFIKNQDGELLGKLNAVCYDAEQPYAVRHDNAYDHSWCPVIFVVRSWHGYLTYALWTRPSGNAWC